MNVLSTVKSEYQDNTWCSMVEWPCGHMSSLTHTKKTISPFDCLTCKRQAQKKEEAKLARQQARAIKPRKDGEDDPKFPEFYQVKARMGGHNVVYEYLGKTPGLEAAIEKHFRKHGNNAFYLATGALEFKGVEREAAHE